MTEEHQHHRLPQSIGLDSRFRGNDRMADFGEYFNNRISIIVFLVPHRLGFIDIL